MLKPVILLKKRIFKLEERIPIWLALSEFYLDTGLDDSDLRHIAYTFLESPYSFEEIKAINKYEVFPVLQSNLYSVAGNWAGFDEIMLADTISTRLRNVSRYHKMIVDITYPLSGWMQLGYWTKATRIYNKHKIQPDDFIVACRAAYKNGMLPFQFEKFEDPIYRQLEEMVDGYHSANRLQEFQGYLEDRHYYINIWVAYFLMEKFTLDDITFNSCYRLIKGDHTRFTGENQMNNCLNWLDEKRKVRG
jgi:hypothetical protein